MLNVLSTAGASILAIGYLLPAIYLRLVIEVWRDRRRESMAGSRVGVERPVASANREFHRDSNR